MKEVQIQLVWWGVEAFHAKVRLARLVQGETSCDDVDLQVQGEAAYDKADPASIE